MESETIPQKVGDRPELIYLTRYVRPQLTAACADNPQAWKDLGNELIRDGGTAVLAIAANNQNVTSCCASMFDKWLQKDPKASWRQLIKALNNIGLDALATGINEKLESLTPSQVPEASVPSNQESLLDQDVKMFKVNEIIIPNVMAHWKDLAYAMEYCIADVEGFDGNGRNLKERCNNLITNWLTTAHGPTPKTYQTLLKYIKKVDHLTAAAETIKEKLLNPPSS